MSRRRHERADLRAFQRRVWGDKTYEAHLDDLRRTRNRRASFVAVLAGAQMLVVALALLIFPGSASAHTSQITISCTQVEFNYSEFPQTSVSAHESILIDGIQGPQRDFQFTGPAAIDIITITLGPGTHTLDATTEWTFFGQPQGSAEQTQDLSGCTPPESTSTTTSTSTTSTTTTMPTTSTTIAEATTVPTTSTSVPASTTTSLPASTTTSSTASSSTTSVPVRPQGSTTTSTTIALQPPITVVATPSAPLPFTGSSTRPLSFALAALGLGAIASGIARIKRGGRSEEVSDR